MATCFDKIFCENISGCDITILDTNGNPIDPFLIDNGDDIVFVVEEKPGFIFDGWVDEENNPYYYEIVGENRYLIREIDCSKQYLAKFCEITYSVNVSANNGCMDSYTIHAKYGDIVNIIASNSPSCRFLYWTKNGTQYSNEQSFEYVVTENTTFIANYEIIAYAITAKPNNRNYGTCIGSGEYEYNENVTITATANVGYRFTGWEDGVTAMTRVVVANANKTYIANFVPSTITITTPKTTGGSSIGSGVYPTGAIVSLQAMPDAGWIFSEWEIDKEWYDTQNVTFIASKNVIATPYFAQETYTINFIASPEGQGAFNPQSTFTGEYGDEISVEAIAENGYEFVEWNDGYKQPSRTITILGNCEYIAYFRESLHQYQVTIILNGVIGCPVYIGSQIISEEIDGNIVCYAIDGTRINLAPIIQNGKNLVSITDNNGNVVWENQGDDSVGLIPYTVGNENAQLTLNLNSTYNTIGITAYPINPTTTGKIEIGLNIDGVSETFFPTIDNSKLIYDNIPYGATITLTAPQTVGGYVFEYWFTEKGLQTTTTFSMSIVENMKFIVTYAEES